MDTSNENSVSLNKYISRTGICSRREANALIEAGRVTINNKVAQLGNRVFLNDVVRLDNKLLNPKPEPVYIAFNKPRGIVCTTDRKEKKNIIQYLNYKERLFPIGRLDKASEGLIFLTNDGDIVNKILRAGNNHEKEYVVTLEEPYDHRFIRRMANGIPILGTVTKKCSVYPVNDRTFRIILTQGLNRQIRRMCDYLGHSVQRLIRTRIMHVELGKLKTGQWRKLNDKEVATIHKLVANSIKTEEASISKKKKK